MIGEALILLGALLAALSGVGVVRLSPVLPRLHAVTKVATGALTVSFIGAAVSLGDAATTTTLVLALALQLFTFPVGANLVAHAVYKRGDQEGRDPDALDEQVPPREPPVQT